jgi:hypothetical protein
VGLGRPLHASELGRILRLTSRDPGAVVIGWEREHHQITGPVSLAIDLMLAGAIPKDMSNAVKPPRWAKLLTPP